MQKSHLKRSLSQQNWLLAIAVLAIVVFPLIFVRGEYAGADGQAEEAIEELAPDYEPWFGSLFEPQSGEIESLLFSAQAALGAGVLGYVIGLYRGRANRLEKSKPSQD
jgi:cobalt/nickel transport protein